MEAFFDKIMQNRVFWQFHLSHFFALRQFKTEDSVPINRVGAAQKAQAIFGKAQKLLLCFYLPAWRHTVPGRIGL